MSTRFAFIKYKLPHLACLPLPRLRRNRYNKFIRYAYLCGVVKRHSVLRSDLLLYANLGSHLAYEVSNGQ